MNLKTNHDVKEPRCGSSDAVFAASIITLNVAILDIFASNIEAFGEESQLENIFLRCFRRESRPLVSNSGRRGSVKYNTAQCNNVKCETKVYQPRHRLVAGK